MQSGGLDKKRGQVSLDFLMTYGGAFLILLLIVVALFTLGVFDTSNFLGSKASGFSDVTVKGWSLADNTGILSVALTNQVGQRINITSVSATIGEETREFDVSSLSSGLLIDQTTGVISSAAFTLPSAGSSYVAKLAIHYTNLESGFAILTTGTLFGKSISSSASNSTTICSKPIASPDAGSYVSALSVVLTTENGSTTYYTTNGDAPTTTSTIYSGAIVVPVDTTMTLKAYSVKNGYIDSSTFSGTYVITHALAAPVASPLAGAYNSSQNVTLTAENGSTIYYTIDGSPPTASSPVYSSPINAPLDANTTIKAYSTKSGYADSPVFSGTYVITRPPSPAQNGSVVLWMDFDNDVGTIAVDSSTYGNNGTIVNANHVSGISGQALQFNGTGYVSVPNSASLNVGNNMSVEAWVRWDTNPLAWANLNTSNKWANVVSKGEDRQWRLQHSSNNGLFEFAVSDSAWVQSTTSPHQGQWYHVIGTANSTHISIYVNGNREAYKSYTGQVPASTWDLNIGRRGSIYNSRLFFGTIDSVRVYNRTLLASEIS